MVEYWIDIKNVAQNYAQLKDQVIPRAAEAESGDSLD